jgi:hypothetical protein
VRAGREQRRFPVRDVEQVKVRAPVIEVAGGVVLELQAGGDDGPGRAVLAVGQLAGLGRIVHRDQRERARVGRPAEFADAALEVR